MKYVVALCVALLMNAIANLLMKVGASRAQGGGGLLQNGLAGGVVTILKTPALLIGLVCFALNAGFYMYALQSDRLKISLAYPIMVGGGYALIATVAYLFLQERLSGLQWLGVSMILLGVCIVAGATSPGHP
ncbi:MAG TPA: SMR family transporter [Phycisphaerae bacterium]|jgi:small multidrug resistance pump